jgi:hypothetical protein
MSNLEKAKSNVLQQLRTNLEGIRVVFTKKDGTDREMLCTLAEGNIPSEKQPTAKENGSASESAVRVFDIEKQEWRSFRWDSVKTVNGVNYGK